MENKKLRIDFSTTDFMTLWRWSKDHKEDAPEIALIYRILEKKFDRMLAREWYTDSLTASTQEEREEARQRYLDRRGVHPDFRWKKQ